MDSHAAWIVTLCYVQHRVARIFALLTRSSVGNRVGLILKDWSSQNQERKRAGLGTR